VGAFSCTNFQKKSYVSRNSSEQIFLAEKRGRKNSQRIDVSMEKLRDNKHRQANKRPRLPTLRGGGGRKSQEAGEIFCLVSMEYTTTLEDPLGKMSSLAFASKQHRKRNLIPITKAILGYQVKGKKSKYKRINTMSNSS